jgi:TRAP-type mannitol/chloroaromatic compound transport system permease small subunit
MAGVALLSMAVIGALDVVLGRGFNLSVKGARELTELTMVAAAFLGMALAQQRREHVRVTLVTERLSPWLQTATYRFGLFLSAAVMSAIAWYGLDSAWQSFTSGEFSPGSLAVPVWPAKAVLGLGATLMALECVSQMLCGDAGQQDEHNETVENTERSGRY